jgi:SEC-C motif
MADQIPDTLTSLGTAVERLLLDRGPMTEKQLLVELGATGSNLGRDPKATLADVLESDGAPLLQQLVDDRWALLPALLLGRVFTHRVSAAEVEHDFLAVAPDLQPLSMVTEADPYRQLVDGAPLTELLPDFDVDLMAERGIPADIVPEVAMLLPRGRLAAMGVRPGGLIGMLVDPAGWDLTSVDDVGLAIPDGVGELLSAALAAGQPDQPAQLDSVVWTACAADPELFRAPMPPLGDLLDQLGLAWDGDFVAPEGFDFPAWRTASRIQSIRRLHDVDETEAMVVLAITSMYDRVAVLLAAAVEVLESGGEPESVLGLAEAGGPEVAGPDITDEDDLDGDDTERALVRDMLPFLAEPAVAEAVLAETIGAGREGAVALGVFAESLEPMAPRAARVALRWLRHKALERLGRVGEAEAELGAAQSLDPSWPPVLLDLARYASDRGDAERALDLLRRAGAPPEDFLVVVLEAFRPPDRSDLGRNQPCWCGSGRKYKQCHLRREQLPLDERAAWLYQKAGMYLADGPWREAVIEVAATRSLHQDSPAALYAATQDPVVTDAVLFEGGAFEAFLAERGFLLPEDERLLGEQWLLIDRSVFEVEAVRAGKGMTVRDLRTGDRHEVRERTGSRQLETGMFLCARIVPAGETTQIFGGVEVVALHQRDELIALLDDEPDPVEIVAFLSSRFAPPQMQNTEGDPLVICEAQLRVLDPDALTTALDRTFVREDSELPGLAWHEYVTTQGMQRVRASLRLDGDVLTVETNSEARMDRILTTLRGLHLGLRVTDDTRRPAADLMEAMSRATPAGSSGGPAPTPTIDLSSPEIVAVLDQATRQYERAWLDDQIPALAGRTPREAAADPTRRPDLIRLIDSFPADDGQAFTMSPGRLREALGLD